MSVRKRDVSVFILCFLIAAVCLLICSKSSPLYPLNDWTDANAYLTCGKGMLNGLVIYRDLYEHKGPLVYGLHALCALVDSSSFLGVYFLEVLVVGLFLAAVYKILSLYKLKQSAWVLLPVAVALTLSSISFQSGDSAEELCLPLLAWPMFWMLRWLKQEAPNRMSRRTLIASGFLGGCVLWIKFTILGFFVPYLLGLMLYHFIRKQPKNALTTLGWFAAGAGIATIPWIIYFGINGAILPWLKTYFYDNLFLYSQSENVSLITQTKAMLKSAWDWFTINVIYTIPMALGTFWFTLTKRHSWLEKGFVWLSMLFLGLGVFAGGKEYLYYGFIFVAFSAFLLMPVGLLLDHALRRTKVIPYILAGSLCLLSLVFCFTVSPNTKDILKPKEETMQYRFAELINEVPNATLLNYFFMDSGFYTAAGVAPTVKYFHYTNVPLKEMLDEQIRYITEGITDFVVTRGREPDTITDHYTLIATEEATEGSWYDTVYLYKRNDLISDN